MVPLPVEEPSSRDARDSRTITTRTATPSGTHASQRSSLHSGGSIFGSSPVATLVSTPIRMPRMTIEISVSRRFIDDLQRVRVYRAGEASHAELALSNGDR